ncbi:hypothetical protein [Treponema zioleckii]|uniref:hypothetical protein n=1 Tax=Treponema zioleckii TaxID=331680 RepID=UPI00168A7B75|nr:hypothetical protein [Treponema zioleckii]
MCLIFTILAALSFSGVYLYQKKHSEFSKSVFTTMLMFWAASFMWSMDGVASALKGEGFFDLSVEDTILGTIIVASGMLIFAVLSIIKRRKNA